MQVPLQYDANHPLADHMCFIMDKFDHVHVRVAGGGILYIEVQVEQV